jgi:hypothetical protein
MRDLPWRFMAEGKIVYIKRHLVQWRHRTGLERAAGFDPPVRVSREVQTAPSLALTGRQQQG